MNDSSSPSPDTRLYRLAGERVNGRVAATAGGWWLAGLRDDATAGGVTAYIRTIPNMGAVSLLLEDFL